MCCQSSARKVLATAEARSMLLRKVTRHTMIDPAPLQEAKKHLASVLAGDMLPDPRDVCLLTLAKTCSLLDDLVPPAYSRGGVRPPQRFFRHGPHRPACAALSLSLRARRGGLIRSLDLGIEFRTDEHDGGGEPHPGHEADDGAERPIGFVEFADVGGIPGEQHRQKPRGPARQGRFPA